jgi:DNA-binding NtrC family response regulator
MPSLRILLVDDEALIRWAAAETLTAQGHSVVEAVDARSTLATLRNAEAPFDVVLLDYRMPDSNDLTLLAAIRRAAPTTQVILVTAYGAPDVTRGALELGAYRVVSKPVDMHVLAALVTEAHGAAPA